MYIYTFSLLALKALQENSQFWKAIQLHQEEPQCSGDQEELALQTGEKSAHETDQLLICLNFKQ